MRQAYFPLFRLLVPNNSCMATLYLFHEIFALTGPLSRYLQIINIEFSNVVAMIDSTIVNSSAGHILQIMETAIVDFTNLEWEKLRICRRRQLDGIESEESPEDQWRRNTFFAVIDTILSSMRNRFEKNKSLYQILSVFSPFHTRRGSHCDPRLV